MLMYEGEKIDLLIRNLIFSIEFVLFGKILSKKGLCVGIEDCALMIDHYLIFVLHRYLVLIEAILFTVKGTFI